MDDQFLVTCPYCDEEVEIYLESDVKGSFVQDCEVCCNPWRGRVGGSGGARGGGGARGRGPGEGGGSHFFGTPRGGNFLAWPWNNPRRAAEPRVGSRPSTDNARPPFRRPSS